MENILLLLAAFLGVLLAYHCFNWLERDRKRRQYEKEEREWDRQCDECGEDIPWRTFHFCEKNRVKL